MLDISVNVLDSEKQPDQIADTIQEYIRGLGNFDTLTAAQIAHAFSDIKLLIQKVEDITKPLYEVHELIKNFKLPEAFDREQIKTFTLQDGTRVTVSQNTFCQIVGDKEDAYKWLRDNGYPDAIKPTVNSSTLKAIAGEILGDHDAEYDGPMDLPEDLFKVSIQPTTSVTRSKK